MARTKLTDLYKSLKDTPLIYENVETLQVKLGGDEKTELKISNQTGASGDIDLSNVTLEFKGEKYEGLEFKFEEVLEDHENEGKDALFVAETDDKIFEVEVNIEADYDQSGRIQDVEWRSLETFPKDVKEAGKRPDYADVDGDGDEEESMEKAFKDKEKMDEAHCTEEEIAEGTCGYSTDGKPRRKPAGPNLMRERFQKLANIIK